MKTDDFGNISFGDDDLLREFIGQKKPGDYLTLTIEARVRDISNEGFSFAIESASSDEYVYEEVDDEYSDDGDDMVAGTEESPDDGGMLAVLLGGKKK